MSKKTMVLALAVACAALFALPAAASAQSWHNSISGAASNFSVSGKGGTLTSADGINVSCTGTSGSGSFSTTTEGTASLKFTGCTAFGFACNSPGAASGTISLSNSFDAIEPTKGASGITPGVLLTPDSSSVTELTPSGASAGKKFIVEFSCFLQSVKVYGNGVIGTIHSPDPACGVASHSYGLNFESSMQGHQKDLTWTGTTYDLISNSSSSHPTASLDGTATLTYSASASQTGTITCTA
jgi:hypothetical protein